ncbi:MAG: hypothetical protein AAFX06_09080, partial [Planctomycetota bacterium]
SVDRFQQPQSGRSAVPSRPSVRPATARNETAFWQPLQKDRGVVHTAMMQSEFEAPPLPGGGATGGAIGLPPETPGASIPTNRPFPTADATPPPATTTPRSLPVAPPSTGPGIASPSDLTPIPQPQLNTNAFSTVNNCRLISGPSTYTAAMGYGCGTPVVPTGYGGPVTTGGPVTSPFAGVPAEYAPAAALPPTTVVAPTAPFANRGAAPARSLFTLGQENYQVQVGQGLWGQPKAYVPGQNVRNWVRYFFP